MPSKHRTRLAGPSLPEQGMALGGLLTFVQEAIAPYPTGNGHPAFFAWINSPPSAPGVIAELLATAVNATCGMGEHALMDSNEAPSATWRRWPACPTPAAAY
ncbi:hypothetical protein AB0M87_30945 [Streptomyces sp. NPDC051320]|uniref:hypothetical protein n=1 Tax=Streptomyces sp. NPDC051320 TaxID=3154644 RepID=UPI0034169BA5